MVSLHSQVSPVRSAGQRSKSWSQIPPLAPPPTDRLPAQVPLWARADRCQGVRGAGGGAGPDAHPAGARVGGHPLVRFGGVCASPLLVLL